MTEFRFHDVFKSFMLIDSCIPVEKTIKFIEEKGVDSIIFNWANGYEENSLSLIHI